MLTEILASPFKMAAAAGAVTALVFLALLLTSRKGGRRE